MHDQRATLTGFQAEHEFAKECKDTSTPVTSNAEKLSTFDHDFQFEESMKKKSNPIGGTAKTVKDNIKKETSGSPPDTAALVKKLSAKETFYNFNVDKLTCHIQVMHEAHGQIQSLMIW